MWGMEEAEKIINALQMVLQTLFRKIAYLQRHIGTTQYGSPRLLSTVSQESSRKNIVKSF